MPPIYRARAGHVTTKRGTRSNYKAARDSRMLIALALRIGHGRMDPECATEAVVSRSAQRLAHYHPCRARDGHARGVSVPQPLQWRSWRQQPLRLLRSCRHDAASSQHPPASEPRV